MPLRSSFEYPKTIAIMYKPTIKYRHWNINPQNPFQVARIPNQPDIRIKQLTQTTDIDSIKIFTNDWSGRVEKSLIVGRPNVQKSA